MFTILLVIIYVAFISLGIPDSILGSAWPSMYEFLNVPVGYAGIITMIIAACTIISSLSSNWMNKKLGTGNVMVISVALTAAALFGFSKSTHFIHLCLLGIPYGLGGGSVDAALNNYVALHYKSRHMSWLHCFWGIGTMAGPIVMSSFIERGGIWTQGYRAISIFQVCLVAVLILSLPLWKKAGSKANENEERGKSDTQKQCDDVEDAQGCVKKENKTLLSVMKVPGVKVAILTFLCYCAVESTTGLWASTYMVFARGIDINTATRWAMLFYAGITAGRFLSGFVSEKLGDKKLVRIGYTMILAGILLLLLRIDNKWIVCAGFICAGFGCAPIYPSLIHQTPINFGSDNSQLLIGLQMACAYTGSTLMPPLFGLLVQTISVALLPFFILFFLVILVLCNERMNKVVTRK